jgi:hypothetical protein
MFGIETTSCKYVLSINSHWICGQLIVESIGEDRCLFNFDEKQKAEKLVKPRMYAAIARELTGG